MTVRSDRPQGLGRGLAALIPQRAPRAPARIEIPLARIRENPRQPRRRMDDEALESLAESIRQHGVIQPVLVTETIDGYQLVAGERRVRAARLAGLERIPAIVRQLADREQLELALVENLQREDLDPIEAARAYRQLIDEFALHPGGPGDAASGGRDRRSRTRCAFSTSTRRPGGDRGRHASPKAMRARSAACRRSTRPASCATIVDDDLSVRQTEELVRRVARATATARRREPSGRPIRTSSGSRRTCAGRSGTKVRLARTRRGGRIVIEYFGDEELARLYQRLVGGAA